MTTLSMNWTEQLDCLELSFAMGEPVPEQQKLVARML